MLMHTPFNAEGIVTKIFTDANGTQHIGLHPIPDRSGLWRYLSTTLLLLTMLGSAIYNGVQAPASLPASSYSHDEDSGLL